MGDSGQTLSLGSFIAGAGVFYPVLAPILGWIGTYMLPGSESVILRHILKWSLILLLLLCILSGLMSTPALSWLLP